jgi:hypothetical protein
MRGRHGWDRSLDRISNGIYENTVGLHRREHQQYRREHRELVRRAAALQFGEKLAYLKEQLTQNRAMLTRTAVGIGCNGLQTLAA